MAEMYWRRDRRGAEPLTKIHESVKVAGYCGRVDAEQDHLAIDVRGAVKTYGAVRALDGLDLSVTTGEVHGFLGPNGAGKSTTLRALLGLHRTDAGTLRLLGKDPWRDATTVHRQLAYVPGDVSLWPNLTGGEVIDLLIRMRGEDPARTRRDEHGALRAGPDEEGPGLLQGQPAEGRPGGGPGR
jgi:ABC-type glutathione transport system ATPase component